MDAIRRRRRRHRWRLGTGCAVIAAALVVATPPVVRAVGHSAGPGVRSAPAIAPGHPAAGIPPPAAPGTVLHTCGAGNGQLGPNWRAGSVHAGPLYFLDGGHSHSRIRLYVVIVAIAGVKPGSAVVVRDAPAARPYLLFLFGPADSLSPGTRYTMRSGESGVTFIACSPGAPRTSFYGGALIEGQRCLPVQVWAPERSRPATTHIGACPGWGSAGRG